MTMYEYGKRCGSDFNACALSTRPRLARLLALAIATTLAAQATAQGSDGNASSAEGPEEIVVTGSPIKDSLRESIAVQRESVNVVNAIASDTIGRFPDQTAAAALTRLPAVAVQRDQGQERYIQVRGAPQHWTAVAFNGVNVLGAEDRVFRFDSVPAVLIDSVRLNKTLTPDMPAEALAGRVDITTFSPLDNPGWTSQLDAGFGKVDLGDGDQEQYSGRFSYGGERWGAMLAGSHLQFDQEADNSEPTWSSTGLLDRLRTAKYQTTRETNSLSGRLEFEPASGQRLSLTSLYTEFLDHELRNQYTFNFSRAAGGTRTPDSGSLIGVPVDGLFEEGNYSNSIFYNVLRGDHELGAWNGTWQLGYTRTRDKTDLPLISQSASTVGLRPSLDYSISDPRFPRVQLYDTVSDGAGGFTRGSARTALNQQGFDTEGLTRYGMSSASRTYTTKLDLEREWTSLGANATFRVGAQYDDRGLKNPGNDALLRPDGSVGTLDLGAAAAELGVAWTPLAFVTDSPWDEDFDRGYTTNYIDNHGMRDQHDALIAAARAANAAGTGNYALPAHDAAQKYDISEEIAAAYAMNTWQWGRHSLLAGARVERVSIHSDGAARVGSALTPLSVGSEYTDVFPSVHWNVDLSDTLKFRLSGITGAARPGFSDLRANVTVNDGSLNVRGGNPDLEPERAYGIDSSIEWYFAPGSLLSANAFYRDVKDVLFESTTLVSDARFNFVGVDRVGYDYVTTLNGSDGELQGIELSYYQPWSFLPGFWSGFGFQGSVAFIDGSFRSSLGRSSDFPGTSDQIANLSLFYEAQGLSVRLSYQYRSDWIDAIGADAATDLYWEATERVDLSARYQFNDKVTLYADAVNLTDELGIRYQGDESRPTEIEGFGRRYLFGARFSF